MIFAHFIVIEGGRGMGKRGEYLMSLSDGCFEAFGKHNLTSC